MTTNSTNLYDSSKETKSREWISTKNTWPGCQRNDLLYITQRLRYTDLHHKPDFD